MTIEEKNKKLEYIRKLKEAESVRSKLGLPVGGVPIPSEDPTDPHRYSGTSGGVDLRRLMLNEIMKEYKPDEILPISAESMRQELIKKEAGKQLMQEGYNPFGNGV